MGEDREYRTQVTENTRYKEYRIQKKTGYREFMM